jgi:hypothetical protein
MWSSHHFGSDSPWLKEAAANLLGVPFAIGFLIFLGWILVRANSLWKIPNSTTWKFVVVCLAGCLPLVALHIVSVNHMMRLLTPALIPGIGVVAVLLDLGGLLKRRVLSVFIALLLVIQVAIIAWQISRMVFQDPWDWASLRELARAFGLPNPTIVVIAGGLTPTFNPPQIQYPWLCHGETISEPPWLQDHPIDWSKVNDLIAQADIVLTGPGNDELERQLRERSWMPVNLYLGVDIKATFLVFFQKRAR